MQLLPGVVALVVGVALAVVLLVPYVAVQYRRRGELGVGRTVLALAVLVYGLALVAYVLLPLPSEAADVCARYDPAPQLTPLQAVHDVAAEGLSGPSSLLRNSAALQIGFNVLLFVPLGAFARHLFGRTIPQVIVLGAVVSLLLELTQLTGDWFAYPCAYRLFDVDDLIVNTFGAAVGGVVAPVLRLVPGQRDTAPAGRPRPVTLGRRLLGMLCDVVAVGLGGSFLVVVQRAIRGSADGASLVEVARSATSQTLLLWLVPGLAQLALVLFTGSTLGELIVRLRPTSPGRFRLVLARPFRWLFGIGGFCLLQLPVSPVAAAASVALAVVSLVVAAASRGRRGLAYLLTGLDVADARTVAPEARRKELTGPGSEWARGLP